MLVGWTVGRLEEAGRLRASTTEGFTAFLKAVETSVEAMLKFPLVGVVIRLQAISFITDQRSALRSKPMPGASGMATRPSTTAQSSAKPPERSEDLRVRFVAAALQADGDIECEL